MSVLNKAKWIMDSAFHGIKPIDYPNRNHEDHQVPPPEDDRHFMNHHMLVRKTFVVNDVDRKKVELNITADDYYKLFINGIFVGQGPAPAYHFHYNYNTLPIMDYLVEGENVIAIHVFYQGLYNRVWTSGDYRQGVIANVVADGEEIIETDSSWKTLVCKAWGFHDIIAYNTQFAEDIDGRKLPLGWKLSGYDDSEWADAYVNLSDDHRLFPQITSNLSIYSLEPEIIKEIQPGYFFVDMGHELVGQVRFVAQGEIGQKLVVRCGEEVSEGGTVRFNMRCNCDYQEFWTLSGGKDQVDFFDYMAFRYFEIIAPEGAVDLASIEVEVRHAPLDNNNYRIETSNEVLRGIFEICKSGVKYCSQEGYLDCPSREKGQYLGDGTITSYAQMLLSGDSRMYKKMLYDFAYSTRVCSGMLCVVPASRRSECADYSCQYPEQLLNYYNYTGDIETLKELYPIALGIEAWFDAYAGEDGLVSKISEKTNLVDWPKNLRDNYDFDENQPIGDCRHVVMNAFYYGLKRDVNRLRDILKIPIVDDLQSLKKSFIDTFYNSMTNLFVDSVGSRHSSLHANILPLYYGLTPDDGVSDAVALVRKKGLACGVYMAYFVLKALANAGAYHLMYELLVSEDEHSWGNMLKEGATTCFEAWGKDQKWNTSLCHAWASAPVIVLLEDLAGVKASSPGWKTIRFEPHFPKELDFFKLRIKIPLGWIEVTWEHGQVKIKKET